MNSSRLHITTAPTTHLALPALTNTLLCTTIAVIIAAEKFGSMLRFTWILVSMPRIPGTIVFYEGSLNSFSFYYNVNTTRYGDTYLQPYSINMISYFDDACTPADHYEAETQRGGVEPITCERGFSYTLSNEMPSVPSVASYIK
jgi:hypothetical protein